MLLIPLVLLLSLVLWLLQHCCCCCRVADVAAVIVGVRYSCLRWPGNVLAENFHLALGFLSRTSLLYLFENFWYFFMLYLVYASMLPQRC